MSLGRNFYYSFLWLLYENNKRQGILIFLNNVNIAIHNQYIFVSRGLWSYFPPHMGYDLSTCFKFSLGHFQRKLLHQISTDVSNISSFRQLVCIFVNVRDSKLMSNSSIWYILIRTHDHCHSYHKISLFGDAFIISWMV